MNNRNTIQKRKEWKAIENIIPAIEEILQINDIFMNKLYESESPDFLFKNGAMSIGVEVVECHPSVIKGNKDNAPAMTSYQEKICDEFIKNPYLASISIGYEEKLNILIDKGSLFNSSQDIMYVCSIIESFLKAWHEKKNPPSNEIIRRIRVHPSKGKNIVQFNNIARRDPIRFKNISKCIEVKHQKLEKYIAKSNCDEYWLCIFLPFEENVQSNCIEFENEEQLKFFNEYIDRIKYNRVCLTSIMSNDINWLKGDTNI